MRLKERVAIVTGGSSGIGRAIAILFANEGAKVAITGRNPERLSETEKSIRGSRGQCISILGDLTKLSDIEKVVENTVKEFGKIDILVNCVGIFVLENFLEVSEELYNRIMNVNIKSVFFMCQMAAREMVKQGKGKIITFGSVAGGKIGVPSASAYCTSKGGVASLTQALAVELAPYHINVNAISPGNIRTPLNERMLANPEYLKKMIEITPLGRIGETPDVTFAVLYLASEESDYITGIQLIIDGGIASQ